MFGPAYFGRSYFGGRYFGAGGDTPASGASAAAVWAYVLPNGKSAGQNLAEINTVLTGALEGTFTAADLWRVIAAVAAGKSRITPLGSGAAHVEFDAVDGSAVRVAAQMDGSERESTTVTP